MSKIAKKYPAFIDALTWAFRYNYAFCPYFNNHITYFLKNYLNL